MLSQRANLQTAAFSIRSGFWRCVFFSCLPEGERGETESGGLGGRAADKCEMCLVLGGTAHAQVYWRQSLESRRLRFTAGGDNLKKVTVDCEAKPNQSVFLTNEL